MGLPVLTTADLSRGIPQADLERIVHLFAERKYPKGATIFGLTHEELANLVGTTRETVSTQMSRSRGMGLIRREGKTLILDVARRRKVSREEEPRE